MASAPSPSYAHAPPARAFFTTPPYAVTWTPPQGMPAVPPPPPSSRVKTILEPGSWGVMPPVAMVFGALMAVIFHFSFVVTPPRVAFARAVFARATAAAAPTAATIESAEPKAVAFDQLPPKDSNKRGARSKR